MEVLAANYLQQQGLIIIERNFTCRVGEIDIICREQQELVFVEVRYRKNIAFGTPIESINYKKQRKLQLTATAYIQVKCTGFVDPIYRFDVIGITGDLCNPEIEWLQNVILEY